MQRTTSPAKITRLPSASPGKPCSLAPDTTVLGQEGKPKHWLGSPLQGQQGTHAEHRDRTGSWEAEEATASMTEHSRGRTAGVCTCPVWA